MKAFENTNKVVLDWYQDLSAEIVGGIGLVAHRGDEMLASGFLIPTYSSLCMWEFIRTNPNSGRFSAAKAVKLITQTAIQWAKDHGYKLLVGFVDRNNTSLLKEFKRQGSVVEPLITCRVSRRL